MISPIEAAIQLAVKAHNGQADKENPNQPHMLHVFEVYHRVHEMFSGIAFNPPVLTKYTQEEIEVAALLHDTVEDSKDNPTALEIVDLDRIEREFGLNIREIVDSVTRRDDEFYRDHIYRAKDNEGGQLVKIADNGHNRMRAAKIKQAKWRNKLEFKYAVAASVLNDMDAPTWEQAGSSVQYDGPHAHYFLPDPNGKKIEVSEEEFKTLTRKVLA
jgi:(p)ppGpp synthase/HD superfamily hydrolase